MITFNTKIIKKYLVAVLLILAAVWLFAGRANQVSQVATADAAATNYFLKINGIPGESKDSRHKNDIDVLSWSWGMSQSGAAGTGGGHGAGKVNVHDIAITKFVDASSPKLFLACARGEHIPEIKLISSTEKRVDYLQYKFEDVVCTSFKPGASHGETPMENVTLNYTKLTTTYLPVGALEALRAAWDFVNGIEF